MYTTSPSMNASPCGLDSRHASAPENSEQRQQDVVQRQVKECVEQFVAYY